jgi:hypothetical protein
MAAKFRSEGGLFDPRRIDHPAGSNSPFSGSQRHAKLTAEIGRCLQGRTRASLKEPLPQALAALVQQLKEQPASLSATERE